MHFVTFNETSINKQSIDARAQHNCSISTAERGRERYIMNTYHMMRVKIYHLNSDVWPTWAAGAVKASTHTECTLYMSHEREDVPLNLIITVCNCLTVYNWRVRKKMTAFKREGALAHTAAWWDGHGHLLESVSLSSFFLYISSGHVCHGEDELLSLSLRCYPH